MFAFTAGADFFHIRCREPDGSVIGGHIGPAVDVDVAGQNIVAATCVLVGRPSRVRITRKVSGMLEPDLPCCDIGPAVVVDIQGTGTQRMLQFLCTTQVMSNRSRIVNAPAPMGTRRGASRGHEVQIAIAVTVG
jgi:hypothetical protein